MSPNHIWFGDIGGPTPYEFIGSGSFYFSSTGICRLARGETHGGEQEAVLFGCGSGVDMYGKGFDTGSPQVRAVALISVVALCVLGSRGSVPPRGLGPRVRTRPYVHIYMAPNPMKL